MQRNRWSLGVLSVSLVLAFVSIGAMMRREAVAGPLAQDLTTTPSRTATAALTPTLTLTPTTALTPSATSISTATTTPVNTATPTPAPLTATSTPPIATTTPTPGAGRVVWSFAAKFVCGDVAPGQAGANEPAVKPGSYATEINIHNPFYLGRVDIRKKVLLLVERGEPIGREPRTVQPRVVEPLALADDGATMDDCNRIWQMVYPNTPAPAPMPLIIGYLVILSPVNLDVVDLMTVHGSSVSAESIGIALEQETVTGKRVLAPPEIFPSAALPRDEDLLRQPQP